MIAPGSLLQSRLVRHARKHERGITAMIGIQRAMGYTIVTFFVTGITDAVSLPVLI
jgi:hypothetical protein